MRAALPILPLIAALHGPLLDPRWDHMGMELEVIDGGAGERFVVAGGLTRVWVFSADGEWIRTHDGRAHVEGGDGEYFLHSIVGGIEERTVWSVAPATGRQRVVAAERPLPEPMRFGHWSHEPVLACWRGGDGLLHTLSKFALVGRRPYRSCSVTLRRWATGDEGEPAGTVLWDRPSMSSAHLFQTVDHLLLVDPLLVDKGPDPVLLAGAGEAHYLPLDVLEAREVLREGAASTYDEKLRTLYFGTWSGHLHAIDVDTGESRWRVDREHSAGLGPDLSGQPAERFASSLELVEDLDGDGVRDLLVGDGVTLAFDPAVHHVSGATGAFLATWDAQALGYEEVHGAVRFVPDFGRRVRSLGKGRGFVLSLVPGWGAGEGVILFVRTDGSRLVVREGEA